MTNKILKTSLLFLAILLFAGFSNSASIVNEKEFVSVSDSLYVNKFEVSNAQYRLFLRYLKSFGNSDDYELCVPDSLQWTAKLKYSYNEPLVFMYFWHPAYNDYPVVNISLEAAKKYCEWLTEQYKNQGKKTFQSVVFRLPTEQEWVMFAKALPGHHLPWYGDVAYDSENRFHANVKFRNVGIKNDPYNYTVDGALATEKVGHYDANSLGLFDIIGNVAEMTAEGNIKGGSWDNTVDECAVDKIQDYEAPDPRVGFRVVMEIK